MVMDEKENEAIMEPQKVEVGSSEHEKKDLAETATEKAEKENDEDDGEQPKRKADEVVDGDDGDNDTKKKAKDNDSNATDPSDVKTKSEPENKIDNKSASSPAATAPLTRPAKRARTAYFIFADEKRAEVQKEHKGEGVVGVARALGHLWASMTDEEKSSYQERAAEERTRLAEELEAWKAAGGVVDDEKNSAASKSGSTGGAMVLPIGRIRKICKLDPEVRGLSKEALMLVTKAAELATSKLGTETVRVAQIQNRRKLLPDDVAQVCSSREQFLFLREDVADLVKLQQKEAAAAASMNKAEKSNSKKAPVDETGPKMKPLTSYFGAKE